MRSIGLYIHIPFCVRKCVYCDFLSGPATRQRQQEYVAALLRELVWESAQIMQPLFTSWDELMDSYLCGYEYWSEESSEERRAVYEDLKGREDSPYKIDYNLVLEKTW